MWVAFKLRTTPGTKIRGSVNYLVLFLAKAGVRCFLLTCEDGYHEYNLLQAFSRLLIASPLVITNSHDSAWAAMCCAEECDIASPLVITN